MLTISQFYGISVRMLFQQTKHNPPYIHAFYGTDVATIEIHTGKMMEGFLPPRILRIVQSWVQVYKREFQFMWNTQQIMNLPTLENTLL